MTILRNTPKITPELDVDNLDESLKLYVDILGFSIIFSRPEERFAYLDRDNARLMLEEAAGPGRRFHTAPLERPYGRGINLQIEVDDVDVLYDKAQAAGITIVIPLEEKWYRCNQTELGNKQFVMADLDGYLLRFFSDLGERPAKS